MAPEHKNPTRDDRRALAPYNFVPVPDKVIVFRDEPGNPLVVDQSQYHRDRLTGWIDLAIETKSPVYVRGPLTPDQYKRMEKQEADPDDKTPHLQKERNRPNFFHTGDPGRPAIPGSSLRGMLRTLAEILGQAKLQPVSDSALIYRAVADTSSHGDAYRAQLMREVPGRRNYYEPRFKGGYIRAGKDGSWFIQPATEVNGTTFARVSLKKIPREELQKWHNSKNASQVYVTISDYDFKQVRGGHIHIKRASVREISATAANHLHAAVLARSGKMFSKRTEAVIFAPDDTKKEADWIHIPDEDNGSDLVTAYRDQITPEQQKLLGRDGVLRDQQPVFYLMNDDSLVFFGHTQMFRLPYERSPQEMLPSVHRAEDVMDLAEAIFGRVKGESGGEAGRVFVGDALLATGETDPWLPGEAELIPRILSGPKPTTFQHYLTQDRPDVDKGKGLHTYNASPRQSTLRGYKLYWHKGDAAPETFRDNLSQEQQRKDTQHTRIKPVRSGVRFHGRIRFENLLPAEFGLLWWVLSLPADGEYAHKIGMGKPLGLGAIALTPEVEFVRARDRYQTLVQPEKGSWQWADGLEPAEKRNEIVDISMTAFENLVSSKNDNVPVARIPRVQDLLAMLSWPGPNPEETRYMEIERPDSSAKRGKRNEYRDRPVLPTPTDVLQRSPARPRPAAQPRKARQLDTDAAAAGQQTGTVKTWKGGYGFIKPDDGGRDVFVHNSALPGNNTSLRPGQRVRYRSEVGKKGPKATWLELIDS